DAMLGVPPHDLDEQRLLGAEVVVEQPPADARLARDVLEGRAGDAPPGDAGAHRLDDPLGLLPTELPGLRGLHGRNSTPWLAGRRAGQRSLTGGLCPGMTPAGSSSRIRLHCSSSSSRSGPKSSGRSIWSKYSGSGPTQSEAITTRPSSVSTSSEIRPSE